jgi:two-component system sensor histidine kinase BaeS
VKHPSLAAELFVLVVASASLTAVLTGIVAHESLLEVVHTALSGIPELTRSQEEVLLRQAELAIVQGYDAGSYIVAAFAAVTASLVALMVAFRLGRPIRQLKETVEGFTQHGRKERAQLRGPSEIVSLATAFNQMADALEEEDHLRRKLVADIAHELRNPIAVASAQTEAMLEGVLPADPPNLTALLGDLHLLWKLMEDLQEAGIAASGRWRYQMALFDLSAVLVQNAERARQRVSRGIEVRTVGVDEPVMIYGDELRLAQAIRNVLGNAKRHTTSGSIILSLDAAPKEVTVTIADTGEGIAPEHLPHVFDRFFRADVARSTDTGGVGLGLAIVSSIVRDHGGDVFAESELGRGTVIGFTLPRDGDVVPSIAAGRLAPR